MPIEFKKTVAVFGADCTIEDAEALLEWLLEHPKGKLNLKKCTQCHTAVVQVMMAAKPALTAQPDNQQVQNILTAIDF